MSALRVRSVLFAPGNRGDVLAKMPRSRPDVAVIDLEDAVPASSKAEARVVAGDIVPQLVADAPSMHVFVRVNASVSEYFEEDLASVSSQVTAVVVPKLESASQAAQVVAACRRHGIDAGVFAGIETAGGVEYAVDVLSVDGVIGAYFGAEDFIADMGGVRTPENAEVSYARSRVAIAGRLAGVPVVDQIVADFNDEGRFAREAAEARAMGYAGKLCIHPGQVALAKAGFVPSPEELDRARALVAAYDEAVARGDAAIAFDGQMVDEPVAQQARSLLARAD